MNAYGCGRQPACWSCSQPLSFSLRRATQVHPPSHIETVDPTKLAENPEFSNPGVTTQPDGSVKAVVVAGMYSWNPDPIEVPANRPITFRITSADVIHGFEVAGTNANTMAIPAYLSQLTIMFNKPGEYLLSCNEYCGLLHHLMAGKLIVKEAPAAAELRGIDLHQKEAK
jgi:cytochrome c oxidase subunit II